MNEDIVGESGMRDLQLLQRTTSPEPLLGSLRHAVIPFGEPDHRQ